MHLLKFTKNLLVDRKVSVLIVIDELLSEFLVNFMDGSTLLQVFAGRKLSKHPISNIFCGCYLIPSIQARRLVKSDKSVAALWRGALRCQKARCHRVRISLSQHAELILNNMQDQSDFLDDLHAPALHNTAMQSGPGLPCLIAIRIKKLNHASSEILSDSVGWSGNSIIQVSSR
jgi:hypothetical protein